MLALDSLIQRHWRRIVISAASDLDDLLDSAAARLCLDGVLDKSRPVVYIERAVREPL